MTSDGLTFETHLGKGNLEKIMSRFNDYLNDSFGKTLEGPVLSMRSLTLLLLEPEECASRALYAPNNENTPEDFEDDLSELSGSEKAQKTDADIPKAMSEPARQEMIERYRERNRKVLMQSMARSGEGSRTDEVTTHGEDKL